MSAYNLCTLPAAECVCVLVQHTQLYVKLSWRQLTVSKSWLCHKAFESGVFLGCCFVLALILGTWQFLRPYRGPSWHTLCLLY